MTRKMLMLLGLAVALSSSPAMAATLENGGTQTCTGSGNWHFVNNQTGGAQAGQLTATWLSGDTCSVTASKVLGNTQHFNCIASGTLQTASTNLPGRLVLSDFSCDTKCEPDPKGEICGDGKDNDCDGKIDEDCK